MNSNIKSAIVFILLMLTMFSLDVNAKMCKAKTVNGTEVFMWATDKAGKLMVTKNASGTIATMAECPIKVIEVTTERIEPRIVYQDYVEPNPRNKCEEVAKKSCDPEFGGMPLCTTNNLANFCGFCFVSTDGKLERYLNGSPYDASKMKEGIKSCPSDQ